MYRGIATIGVSIWPIGRTDPKCPAASPWYSGCWAIESPDELAGLTMPKPTPWRIMEEKYVAIESDTAIMQYEKVRIKQPYISNL